MPVRRCLISDARYNHPRWRVIAKVSYRLRGGKSNIPGNKVKMGVLVCVFYLQLYLLFGAAFHFMSRFAAILCRRVYLNRGK